MPIKQRLGDLLVRDGLITDSDLRTMLAQQKQHGGRLGEHLVRVNLCTEEQIAQALARQLNIPFNDMTNLPPPAMTKLIPRDAAMQFQALAVGLDPFASRLPVVFADPTDKQVILAVERIVGRNVVPQVASANALRRAIESMYYSVDLRDDGTSEFQVTGLGGQVKKVRVGRGTQEEEPEAELLTSGELEPIADAVPEPAPSESGEEALRMVWLLADLLVERGLVTRAELTRKLRAR
jgi:hypothetical protein